MSEKSGALGVAVHAVSRLCGSGYEGCEIVRDGQSAAAICRGMAYVIGEDGDFAARSVGAVGIGWFISETPLSLDGFAKASVCEMLYMGGDVEVELTEDFDLLCAARLIAEADGRSADEIYPDIFYRTRAGTMRPFAVVENGTLAATAFFDFVQGDSAVVGCVAVKRGFRGKKLGFRAAASAACRAKSAWLICEQALAERYAEFGFRKTRDLYVARRIYG